MPTASSGAAPASEPLAAAEGAAPPLLPASEASFCRCEGDGLANAIVRQANSFTVIACDAGGQQKTEGGDDFAVQIRGAGSTVRVHMLDNKNGSYTMSYNPQTSGEYTVDVTLGGLRLPGSPYILMVSSRTPHPPLCSIVGDALRRAVSREQQFVEVRFKDAIGNAAHAEDVDCYAEPVEDDEAQTALVTPAEEELGFPSWLRAGQPASPRTSPTPRHAYDMPNAAKAKVPLVVRASADTASERLCNLRKGRLVYILEERPESADGSVRALVAIEDEDGEEETWRLAYSSREAGVTPLWGADSTGGSPALSPTFKSQRGHSPTRPRSASPSARYSLSPSTPGGGGPRTQSTPVGWVTIAKEGKSLVTSQGKSLGAGERQQHMVAWERRKQVDKTIAVFSAKGQRSKGDDGMSSKKGTSVGLTNKWKLGAFWNEVTSDPTGVGFAFGGVEPGRLHAKGKCVDVHKLYYSIGRAGKYKLHMGLRHQNAPFPGSPFDLEVVPGPASAITTMVPRGLELRGEVGREPEHGCQLALRSYDFTGNRCVDGGAHVTCTASDEKVVAKTTDNGDGTYMLTWRSERAGRHTVKVLIDEEEILGSPFTLELLPTVPALERTLITGDGLSSGRVGEPAVVNVKLIDAFENSIGMTDTLRFGLALVGTDEKPRRKKRPSDKYTKRWIDEGGRTNNGYLEMRYVPMRAGECHLLMWYETPLDGRKRWERTQLPGSPFAITCKPGRYNALKSTVLVEWAEDADTQTPQILDPDDDLPDDVPVGSTVFIRPQVRDAYGNLTVDDGALAVDIVGPDRTSSTLELRRSSDVVDVESRFEPRAKGMHWMDVLLNGTPIHGSPVIFKVVAGSADASKSYVSLPDGPLYADEPYELVLITVDRNGNPCDHGRGDVTARLVAPELPPGQEASIEVDDMEDGTYVLDVELLEPCEVKLIVTINAIPGSIFPPQDMPPLQLSFVAPEVEQPPPAPIAQPATPAAEKKKKDKEAKPEPPPPKPRPSKELPKNEKKVRVLKGSDAEKLDGVSAIKGERDAAASEAEAARAEAARLMKEELAAERAARMAALQEESARKAAEAAKKEGAWAQALLDKEGAAAAKAAAEKARADAAALAKAELTALREANAAAQAEAARLLEEEVAKAKAERGLALAAAKVEAEKAAAEAAAAARAEREAAIAAADEERVLADAQAAAQRAAKALADGEERAARLEATAQANAERKAKDVMERAALAAKKAEEALAKASSDEERKSLREQAAKDADAFKKEAEKAKADSFAETKQEQDALRAQLATMRAENEAAANEAVMHEKLSRELAKKAVAEAQAKAAVDKAAEIAATKAANQVKADMVAEQTARLDAEEAAKKALRAAADAEERAAEAGVRAVEEALRKAERESYDAAIEQKKAELAEQWESLTADQRATREAAIQQAAESRAEVAAAREEAAAVRKQMREEAKEEVAASRAEAASVNADAAAQVRADRDIAAESKAWAADNKAELVAQAKADRDAGREELAANKAERELALTEAAEKIRLEREAAGDGVADLKKSKAELAEERRAARRAGKEATREKKAEEDRAKMEAVQQAKAIREDREKLQRSAEVKVAKVEKQKAAKEEQPPDVEEDEPPEAGEEDDDDSDSSDEDETFANAKRKGAGEKSNADRKKAQAAKEKKEEATKKDSKRGPGGASSAAAGKDGGGEAAPADEEAGYSSTAEGSPSGQMTKVQYGKLLIAQAKKKLADEVRLRTHEGGQFRKLQLDKFLGGQQQLVEDGKQQRTITNAAIEGMRERNLAVAKELRGNIAELRVGARVDREAVAQRARELVEHAKGVQSPRILASARGLASEKEKAAAEVREEHESNQKELEAFRQMELARKGEIVKVVQSEIAPNALAASAVVLYRERQEMVGSVKTAREEGASLIAKEREEVRTARAGKRTSIKGAREGAKNASAVLSTRRKVEADELRSTAGTNRERKQQVAEETLKVKKSSRDQVLEDRKPPSTGSVSPAKSARKSPKDKNGKIAATP